MPEETQGASGKFSVNGVELSEGTPFTYQNGGKFIESRLGNVQHHDDESVAVIFDETGEPVSKICCDAKVKVFENLTTFITGEQSRFIFNLTTSGATPSL